MYVENPYAKTLLRGEQILLCNTKTGAYVKTKLHYYEIVQACLAENNQELIIQNVSIKVEKTVKYLFQELCKIEYYIQDKRVNEVLQISMEMVYLSITNRCNLKCKHCVASACEPEGSDSLNTVEWKRIIDYITDLEPKQIVFTGGEPLLRKDALELMRYAKEKSNCSIILSTNGILINNENIKDIIEISDAIAISLDGFDEESCSRIRGKGVYSKVIQNIKRLKEAGYVNISLSMLCSAYTEKNVPKFYSLCNELQVKPIVRRFTPTGRGEINREELMPRLQEKELKEKKCYCRLCRPGRRELNITENGDVYPCAPLSIYPQLCMGNVLDMSLDRILNMNKTEELIEHLRPWKMEQCKECDVNLFCHDCINFILGIKQDKKFFESNCKKIKRYLEKIVWETCKYEEN